MGTAGDLQPDAVTGEEPVRDVRQRHLDEAFAGRRGLPLRRVEPHQPVGEVDRAAPLVDVAEPDDVRPEWLAGAAVLHLDGYDLLRYPAALTRAATLAREAGIPVSADVAAATRIEAHGVQRYAQLLADLRPDVLFCNAAEAAVLGETDVALVVAHDGPRPTRVVRRDAVVEVPVDPLPDGELRDTTGCGDALAAGVLAGWRAGAPVADAVRSGHAAAAVVAGVVGAQPPVSRPAG